MYWAVATGVSIWNCQRLQSSYGFQFEYCDDSSGYGYFYDLSHRVGSGLTNLRGPVQFLGFRQALDQFNQGCWFMDVLTADGYRSDRLVCNYGPHFPPPGKMKFAGMLRMDGQTDTGGNPPPLAWKDWTQEKRDEAAKYISPSDWIVILQYMPKVWDLKFGDIIKSRTITSPGAKKDNPTTIKNESSAQVVPDRYIELGPSSSPTQDPLTSTIPADKPLYKRPQTRNTVKSEGKAKIASGQGDERG